MDRLGRSVGDAIGGAFGGVGDALGGRFAGVISAFATVPGGPAWLVLIAILAIVGWRLAR